MTLIKSISGIRGTIGGSPGDNLSPLDIVKFTSAYATWLIENQGNGSVVIGRDARPSGEMLSQLVSATLIGMGLHVIDLGLSTTPTVEMAVTDLKAKGGIILTASHNPKIWNALKLLNNKGEFISSEAGKQILNLAEKEAFVYAQVDELGKYSSNTTYFRTHLNHILGLKSVDVSKIKQAGFKVVVDGVNSSGGVYVPLLLEALGVKDVVKINCEPTGEFAHNPEPLPEHLQEISSVLKKSDADLGIVVDPDVDRLALICENGAMFGEEYTLVAVADHVLSRTKGNTVSNLSSTKALGDVTRLHGGEYHASAVGEVNVVEKMKQVKAIIGGEGNGGIIYPQLHYGRDALVGIALFLTYLAEKKLSMSALRSSFPNYFMAKKKVQLSPSMDVDKVLLAVQENHKGEDLNLIDGVKINFENEWVHLRKSNTEPIIRVYTESTSEEKANALGDRIIKEIHLFSGL